MVTAISKKFSQIRILTNFMPIFTLRTTLTDQNWDLTYWPHVYVCECVCLPAMARSCVYLHIYMGSIWKITFALNLNYLPFFILYLFWSFHFLFQKKLQWNQVNFQKPLPPKPIKMMVSICIDVFCLWT